MFALLIFLDLIMTNFCGDVTGTKPSYLVNPVCKLPRGQICINLTDCEFFAEFIARSPKPQPDYVTQIIRSNQCGFNHDLSPKVCCKRIQSQSIAHFPNKEEEEEEEEEIERDYKELDLLPKDCGATSMSTRITQGTKAALMEFPWMAQLIYHKDIGNKLDSHCGGTLINNRYVLTAAHCALKNNLIGVRLGENDLSTEKDCDEITGICSPPVQDFTIEDIIAHPEYNLNTLFNDIALIRLNASANLNKENVKPICLPLGEEAKALLNTRYGVVTGWGKTENGFNSARLLKILIPIWNTIDCRNVYMGRSLITNKQFCAGGIGGRDACGGDSGGPLMVPSTTGLNVLLYGIVSYGPSKCGMEGEPGIYTRVASYVEWILGNLER